MEAEIKAITSDNKIQLEENRDIERFYIYDEQGNKTGDFIEFDLEDIELLTRYQQIIEDDKKARTHLKFRLDEIERRPDKKGKKLLSANQEAIIKAWQEFYREETRIYNMFLGENGVQKILCGRSISWNTLEAVGNLIEHQILPKLEENAKRVKDKIMKKYSNKKDDDVIE